MSHEATFRTDTESRLLKPDLVVLTKRWETGGAIKPRCASPNDTSPKRHLSQKILGAITSVLIQGDGKLSLQWRTLTIVLALMPGMLGCGSKLEVAPVSGTVLLDGQPLAGASVNTQPISTSAKPNPGSGSFGKTDAQGHYSLEVVDPPIVGAMVGEHRVTITRGDKVLYRSSDLPVKSQNGPWPDRYSDGSLRLTVPPEGTTEANFELTLK